MKSFRLMLAAGLALLIGGLGMSGSANAHVFGKCARQENFELKLEACEAASRLTSFPWVLHWVYREMARAYRARGEISSAAAAYRKSLSASERAAVRQEMEQLVVLTH
jgi:hypothetical protein